MKIPLQNLREDAARVVIPNDSYIQSYPHLLSFFSLRPIDEATFVAAAHMVYGWMPTVLEFGDGSLPDAAHLLSRSLSSNALLSKDELATLKEVINNSLVGTSKLLHFANPSSFPIWDSKVYFYIYGKASYHFLEKPEEYIKYISAVRSVTSDPAYNEIHQSIQRQIASYSITPIRSAELIMFLSGRAGRTIALSR